MEASMKSGILTATMLTFTVSPALASNAPLVVLDQLLNVDNTIISYWSGNDPSYTGQHLFGHNLLTDPFSLPRMGAVGVGDIATGTLKSNSITDPLYAAAGHSVAAQSTVTLNDGLRFHTNGVSTFATFSWYLHGGIYPGVHAESWAFGRLTIEVERPGAVDSIAVELNSYSCQFSSSNICTVGDNIYTTGKLLIPIVSDIKYQFMARLETSASDGKTVLFGNTAGLSLLLPSDVLMTSESGIFLTQASPVPELNSMAMWGIALGFCAIGALRGRASFPTEKQPCPHNYNEA
jgi:hypothetical protein